MDLFFFAFLVLIHHSELAVVGSNNLDLVNWIECCCKCILCLCVQSASSKILFLGRGDVCLLAELKVLNLLCLNSCTSSLSALKKVVRITSVPKIVEADVWRCINGGGGKQNKTKKTHFKQLMFCLKSVLRLLGLPSAVHASLSSRCSRAAGTQSSHPPWVSSASWKKQCMHHKTVWPGSWGSGALPPYLPLSLLDRPAAPTQGSSSVLLHHMFFPSCMFSPSCSHQL